MRILNLIVAMSLVVGTANAGDPGPDDPAWLETVTIDQPVAVDDPWPEANTVRRWNSEIAAWEWVPEIAPGVWHVGLSGGQAEYGAVAGGRSWKDIRFEIELGYGGDEKSEKKCSRTRRKHYYDSSYYRPKSCGRKTDDIWNLTAAGYPTLEVVPKLSVYAGGGLGIRFVGDETEGIGKLAAGLDVEILDGLFLGAGFKAVLALDEGEDEYGPFGGLRYRF